MPRCSSTTVSGWRPGHRSSSSPPTRRAGRISRPCSARVATRRGASASGTRSRTWSGARFPSMNAAFRLREQTDCGHPESNTTSGLVAYLDGEPAGWCAVEPRPVYVRLLRTRVPWSGRAEDKADEGIWAVTCFVTRTGFRRRGVSRALGVRRRRLRPPTRRPSPRGVPDDHRARTGDHLGRAARRQPQQLRRRRVR